MEGHVCLFFKDNIAKRIHLFLMRHVKIHAIIMFDIQQCISQSETAYTIYFTRLFHFNNVIQSRQVFYSNYDKI